MKEYLSEVSQVMAEQKTRPEGLSSSEATERLQKHGPNKLAEGKKESIFVKFLKELADPMIIILLVAAVISSITEYIEALDHGIAFFPTDACIILTVVLINAILGVYQESKAEKAIEALQEMAAATSKVIRDGHQIVVKSEELVPGDIVILNDVYNANPQSMRAAAAVLGDAKDRRRVAVVGDMKELGANTQMFHKAVGGFFAQSGIHRLIAIGDLARYIAQGAQEAGLENAVYYPTMEEAKDSLLRELRAGVTILVKASRSMAFEKIVEFLQANISD